MLNDGPAWSVILAMVKTCYHAYNKIPPKTGPIQAQQRPVLGQPTYYIVSYYTVLEGSTLVGGRPVGHQNVCNPIHKLTRLVEEKP